MDKMRIYANTIDTTEFCFGNYLKQLTRGMIKNITRAAFTMVRAAGAVMPFIPIGRAESARDLKRKTTTAAKFIKLFEKDNIHIGEGTRRICVIEILFTKIDKRIVNNFIRNILYRIRPGFVLEYHS